jgi:TolB protein
MHSKGLLVIIVWLCVFTLILLPAAAQSTAPIAFVSNMTGNNDIYVMNVDGSGVTNLTNHPESDAGPEWSNDGSRITFISRRETPDHFQVFSMNADGSDLRRLTREDAIDFRAPTWSPDGQSIVYSRDENDNAQLHIMNADGSNPRPLLPPDAPPDQGEPDWSPDGSRIVFRGQGERSTEIYVFAIASGQITQLTNAQDNDTSPRWSPDGQLIAFTSRRDGGESKLYVMNADGSSQRRLTSLPLDVQEGQPDWSPDGRTIVFEIEVNDADSIQMLDLLSGATTTLLESAGVNYGSPTWRPDASIAPSIPVIAHADIPPTAVPANLLTLGGAAVEGQATFADAPEFPLDVPQGSLITVVVNAAPEAFFSTSISSTGAFLQPMASIRDTNGQTRELYLVGAPGPYTLQLSGEGSYALSVTPFSAASGTLSGGSSASGSASAGEVLVYTLANVQPGDAIAIESATNVQPSLVDGSGALLTPDGTDFDSTRSLSVTRYILDGSAPYTLALIPEGAFTVALNVASGAGSGSVVVMPGQTVDGPAVGTPFITYTLDGVSAGQSVTLRLDGNDIWAREVPLFDLMRGADDQIVQLNSDSFTASIERPQTLVGLYDLNVPGPYRIVLPGLDIPYTLTVSAGDALRVYTPIIAPGDAVSFDAGDGTIIPIYPLNLPAGADQVTVQIDDPARLLNETIPSLRNSTQVFLRDADQQIYEPVFRQDDETRQGFVFELAGSRPPYQVVIRSIAGRFDLRLSEGAGLLQYVLRPGDSVSQAVPPPSVTHYYQVQLDQPAVVGLLLEPGEGVGNVLAGGDAFRSYPALDSSGAAAGTELVNGQAVNFYSLNAGSYLVQLSNNPRGVSSGTYRLTLLERGQSVAAQVLDLSGGVALPADPLPTLAPGQTVSGTLSTRTDIQPGSNTRDGYLLEGFNGGDSIDVFVGGLPSLAQRVLLFATSSDQQPGILESVTHAGDGMIYRIQLAGQGPHQLAVEGAANYTLRLDGLSLSELPDVLLLRPGEARYVRDADDAASTQTYTLDAAAGTTLILEARGERSIDFVSSIVVRDASGDVITPDDAAQDARDRRIGRVRITLTGSGPYQVEYRMPGDHQLWVLPQ